MHTTIGVHDLGLTDPATVIGFAATAGLLVVFVVEQRLSANPLVPSAGRRPQGFCPSSGRRSESA